MDMKKILLGSIALGALIAAAPAGAADVAVAPRYQAPAPVWSWAGFYLGGHIGAGWGTKHWYNESPFASLGADVGLHHVRGGLGGGQVGYNFQAGNWVFGAELQGSWADLEGNNQNLVFTLGAGGPRIINNSKVDSIVTAAGRLGYAVDRVLVYTTAGGAWMHDKFSTTTDVNPSPFATGSQTRSGWMAGLGLEYAFAYNWSVKFEYDYVDLGRKRNDLSCPVNCAGAPGFGLFAQDITQQLNLFKFGINYRFGYGPVYANY